MPANKLLLQELNQLIGTDCRLSRNLWFFDSISRGGKYQYPGPWASAEFFPGRGKVDILLIFVRLLAMQRKWTYTKRKCPLLR